MRVKNANVRFKIKLNIVLVIVSHYASNPSPEELVGMFFGWADPSDLHVGFAVLPHIKGLTEPL